MKTYYFPVITEQDEYGFVASCPALQGCYTQGDSYEKTMENILDAIKLHLKDRQIENEEIPFIPTVNVSIVSLTI